jgi:hypothetical protein
VQGTSIQELPPPGAHVNSTDIQELPPPCTSSSGTTPTQEGEDLFPRSTILPSSPHGAPPSDLHAPELSLATEGAPITVQMHGQHVQTCPRTQL